MYHVLNNNGEIGHIKKYLSIFLLVGLIVTLFAFLTQTEYKNDGRLSPKERNLNLQTPVEDWYEGIPIGNIQP